MGNDAMTHRSCAHYLICLKERKTIQLLVAQFDVL
ncbi:hypothetical protein NC653_023767 [Populus alba x Populus x berolinensis]|uniref:Uncharacterized protein n=1 Tax=Populus alba x Populus x berolinensis TaxID=444605 RepID=A0AAD6QCL1_9ROSI|nr:hypothetical protein NC653_023767 [Populus alba x Populus x berolinensis]